MNLIQNSNLYGDTEGLGADLPVTEQETFIKAVYSLVDEATACELERLRSEEGIIATCYLGCCQCCRFHILINNIEAFTLAQYIKREFSSEQRNNLLIRTQQWHEWHNFKLGRYPLTSIDEQAALSNYDHFCPMLVNGECSAYPVRPVVCRTHFVCSNPSSCYDANNHESTADIPSDLKSVVSATDSFSIAIKDYIENTGVDFSRSILLLPHYLAIEMGWDFGIAL